ncbi:MAG: hypothetical protein LBD92_00345 [Oscillospiraceae bacterium]|jgi:hypothetical protein|nr:hypothetical protein [Oscillospiraceae bacterium]
MAIYRLSIKIISRGKIPLKAWRDEREALLREKCGLDTEYRLLKDEIRDAEIKL